jgi:ArsR family metal-binding transcriptional regulator
VSNDIIRRRGYSFFLVNIECLPNSDHFNVVMDMDDSIEESLPFLAACLPGCTYIHGTGVINVMDAGHIVAVYPSRITITDVRDLEEGEALCRRYMETIEDVKERTSSISPVYNKKPTLTVFDIFRCLPQTNCGLCQSPSCMAFAAKVFSRQDTIKSCDPVAGDRDKHDELLRRLLINGYESL